MVIKWQLRTDYYSDAIQLPDRNLDVLNEILDVFSLIFRCLLTIGHILATLPVQYLAPHCMLLFFREHLSFMAKLLEQFFYYILTGVNKSLLLMPT